MIVFARPLLLLGSLLMLGLGSLLPTPAEAQTADTLFYQSWDGAPPAGDPLYGFQQYNNIRTDYQNVWARTVAGTTFTGINNANGAFFRSADACSLNNSAGSAPIYAVDPANANNQAAHIVTSRCIGDNANYPGYHTGGSSNRISNSYVGLYSPKIFQSGFAALQLRVRIRCMGEYDTTLNTSRDYGLVKYSLNAQNPAPPVADGALPLNPPPLNYWTNLTPTQDLSVGNDADYPGIDDTIQGFSGFREATFLLPDSAAQDSNLRVAFFWVNDNVQVGNPLSNFPALMVDDIAVVGYRFEVQNLGGTDFCLGSHLPLRLQVAEGLFGQNNQFLVEMSDNQGNFNNLIVLDTVEANGSGTYYVPLPDNAAFVGGGYRIRVRGVSPNPTLVQPGVTELYTGPTSTFGIIQAAETAVSLNGLTNSDDTTLCRGQVLQLTVDPGNLQVNPGNLRYRFRRDGDELSLGASNQLNVQPNGAYTAEVIAGSCHFLSDTLTLDYFPQNVLVFPLDDTACYAQDDSFQLNQGQPINGEVIPGRYEGQGVYGNTTDGFFFNTITAGTGEHTITYIYTDPSFGCEDSITGLVTVPEPYFPRVEVDRPVTNGTLTTCDNVPVTFRLNQYPSTPFYRVNWFPGNILGDSVDLAVSGNVYADLSADGCTYRSDSLLVTLFPANDTAELPILDLLNLNLGSTSAANRIEGRSPNGQGVLITLEIRRPVEGRVGNLLADTTEADSSFRFEFFQALQPGDSLLFLARIDSDCDGVIDQNDFVRDTLVSIIEDSPNNAFSPNSDGVNDTWVLYRNIQQRFPNNSLTIYNRWGAQVYHRQPYDNSWDGDDLPEGVYFYVFDRGDGSDPIRSHVDIIR